MQRAWVALQAACPPWCTNTHSTKVDVELLCNLLLRQLHQSVVFLLTPAVVNSEGVLAIAGAVLWLAGLE